MQPQGAREDRKLGLLGKKERTVARDDGEETGLTDSDRSEPSPPGNPSKLD
jgi:hypothetical protein